MLTSRIFIDACSFKDANISESLRRCSHPTVFRDAIIFKDVAFLEMQTCYRSLADVRLDWEITSQSFYRC